MRVGIGAIPVLLKVNFRLFVQREVDERVHDTEHGGREAIVESEEPFTLPDEPDVFKKVEGVLAAVVLLAHAAERFGLHASAHHPERIRDHVADQATRNRRTAIQPEASLLKLETFPKMLFEALGHGSVHRVEHWRAEGGDGVAAV